MSGHVLIVDSLPARRALTRAALQAAHYIVTSSPRPADAPKAVAALRLDLVLLDLADEAEGVAAIAALRNLGVHAPLIIALIPPDRPEGRLAALQAGADDAMDHGAPDCLLQARIRSLLRARDAAEEMGLREDDEPDEATVGFAESATAFVAKGAGPVTESGAAGARDHDSDTRRVAVIEAGRPDRPGGSPPAMARLSLALGWTPRVLPPSTHPADASGTTPDLFVIDGSAGASDPASGADVLRLLADLRSRSPTRHAATLIVLPAAAEETAAMALDLGAGDVVSLAIRPEELAARMRALIGRKSQADSRRIRIQSRLLAAVRDPLTGLHNRRFAEPMLGKMAARARATGRDLAVMILDIDHFKAINDRHGHIGGDRVLAEVARRLQGALRPGDLIARIGGEEFLVAMPDTTTDQARASAERLRRAVSDEPFAVGSVLTEEVRSDETALAFKSAATLGKGASRGLGEATPSWIPAPRQTKHAARWGDPSSGMADAVTVTMSVGVAIGAAARLESGLTLADLFERADNALYAAKTAGRNMVAMALGAA